MHIDLREWNFQASFGDFDGGIVGFDDCSIESHKVHDVDLVPHPVVLNLPCKLPFAVLVTAMLSVKGTNHDLLKERNSRLHESGHACLVAVHAHRLDVWGRLSILNCDVQNIWDVLQLVLCCVALLDDLYFFLFFWLKTIHLSSFSKI